MLAATCVVIGYLFGVASVILFLLYLYEVSMKQAKKFDELRHDL